MTVRGRVRVEQGRKRVRVMLGGETIADTIAPRLVWEKPVYPTYYFPLEDVRTDLLVETGETDRSPSRGTATRFAVRGGAAEAAGAAYRYAGSPIEELRDLVAFDWHAMDHWFEEDEEVFTHARNPYTRVDVLGSSRHVQIRIDGVTVADSTKPTLLFETGLPVRYYLPKTDVRMDLLTPTDRVTECPYKGTAEYWSATIGDGVHEHIVWSYRFPTAESAKIAGLMAFYDEKVDVIVDGALQERPRTQFS